MVDYLAAVSEAWTKHLRAERDSGHRSSRDYVYASGRRTCVRRMALDMKHPEDDSTFSDDSLERMQRGKEREHSIVARLHQIGPRCSPPFEVIEGQRTFEIRDRDGTLLIRGKTDCRLRFDRTTKPFVEVKSGESFRNVERFEDLDRSPWTRHAPDQLLSYLLAESEPEGCLLIDRPGLPLFIRVVLEDHLQRAEQFLQDARRAIDAVKGVGEMPPFIQDVGECRRCPHLGKSCSPTTMSFGPGVRVITDPDLIAAAETREATAEARADYEAAHNRLKAGLQGVELGVLGPFLVEGRWQKSTKYDIPAEIKKQYAREDPRGGGFRFDVERAVPKEQTAAAPAAKKAEAA